MNNEKTITGTVICAGKLKDNNGDEVRGILIEADLENKTVPFYKQVRITEIDESGYEKKEHDPNEPRFPIGAEKSILIDLIIASDMTDANCTGIADAIRIITRQP